MKPDCQCACCRNGVNEYFCSSCLHNFNECEAYHCYNGGVFCPKCHPEGKLNQNIKDKFDRVYFQEEWGGSARMIASDLAIMFGWDALKSDNAQEIVQIVKQKLEKL